MPSFCSVPAAPVQDLLSGWASPVPLPRSWAVKGVAEASGPHRSSIPYLVARPFWLGEEGSPGVGVRLCSLVLGWYVLRGPELRGAYNKDPPSLGP